MTQYETLYERKCILPLYWDEVGKSSGYKGKNGDSAESSERYADTRKRDLSFEEDDWVYFKVSLMKGVQHFGKKGKLSMRYIGHFQILEKVGYAAYRVALPDYFGKIHDVFHVSSLKKSFRQQESSFVDPELIQLQLYLIYDVALMQIVDWKEQMLKSKLIRLEKVA
ncbi:uncharacterized protein LOC122304545 [Carya illinoinensis]|uniref:uncharacterized protein LOC122304545 n=1 Tax=Carya illinoinensis TaxID=32201 RepID=UPI001C725270|nr:uncharacterized protein LOC122304545 [Carya illinoinensis]